MHVDLAVLRIFIMCFHQCVAAVKRCYGKRCIALEIFRPNSCQFGSQWRYQTAGLVKSYSAKDKAIGKMGDFIAGWVDTIELLKVFPARPDDET